MCDSLTDRCREQQYYWKCRVDNGVDVHQVSSQSLLLLGNLKIRNLIAQPIQFFLYLLMTGCYWRGSWRRVVIFNGPVYSSSFYGLNFTTRDQFEHVSNCMTAILDSDVLAFTDDRWYSRFDMLILIVIHILIMDIRSFVFWPAVYITHWYSCDDN